MLPISLKLLKITSGDFHCCIFLKLLLQNLHFWISTAHDQKTHLVTSQKFENSNRTSLSILCALYFYKVYHSFRLHTYQEETFGSFDFLIGH